MDNNCLQRLNWVMVDEVETIFLKNFLQEPALIFSIKEINYGTTAIADELKVLLDE